ncbi:interferon-induced very large GTPase 1-like [Ambystoma mexicanum]|uniref:interferon-induced very large GTPase 1-like n=1 Tax=Ambystoma mexicanum TaxID=8296 RepID=UPI0037E7A45B
MEQQEALRTEHKPPVDEKVLLESGRQELKKRLEIEGLDTTYWLTTLEEILGVSNAQALKHLTHEDYMKLHPHFKQEWEKRALKNLLAMPDSKVTMMKLQEERLKLMKENKEQAKLTLEELREMHAAGKSQHDEDVKKKLDHLRLAMTIPKEYWPPSGHTLIDVLESVHKQIGHVECSLSSRGNLEDKEMLKWASGGRALQGIYKTNKPEDLLEKRDQLITIPETFCLFGPDQGPIFQIKEFSSSTSESTFRKVMDNLGFTISCQAKIGFMGFSLKSSNDYTRISESEQKDTFHAENVYICTTKYNYIPLASCFFQKHEIKLSSAALLELKEIEELLVYATIEEKFQIMNSKFENFFKRFGSHVDTGPFHFGGIYWWKASSKGFKSEKLEEVKKIATETLNSYVGASYCGFGIGVGVSNTHSDASVESKSTESFHKNIELSVTKTGGPVEVDSLAQWKSGLMASNKTWSVIDRGFNLVPVWDIILHNHKEDFKDVYQVGRSLMESYKAIAKQEANLLFGEELTSAVAEAQAFIKDLESWEAISTEVQLKKLIHFKQKLNEKTKNYSTWIEVCLSSKALPNFLNRVIQKYEHVPANEAIYIKTQIRCIVDSHIYSIVNAHMYSPIMKWVYPSEKERTEMFITSFDQFVNVLQQEESAIQEAISSFNSCAEAVHEAQVKSTCKISLLLNSLLQALRATKQVDIELLLILFVVRLGYSLETSYFRYHLGHSEINFMLTQMQDAYKEYMRLKKQSDYRAQAFLLSTGLKVATEYKVVAREQKIERLCFMRNHMKETLSKEVSDIFQKYNQCNDLTLLEKDMHALTLGNIECIDSVTPKESLVGELTDISTEANQIKTAVSEIEVPHTTCAGKGEAIQNIHFYELMKRLELETYYPKKMTEKQVHVIDQFTLQVTGSQHIKDSDLPFYFLQKLMIMDYRARDLIYKAEDLTSECHENNPDESCTPDESLDIMENLFRMPFKTLERANPKQAPVHPMDLQMTIYYCADDFMRQWISTKLSICQFALPFLMPNPSTSKIEFPLWSFRQVKKNWQQTKECDVTAGKTKYRDTFISGARTPMVSCFRIGESSSSKSQLMNRLLSDHNHNIYFHRHCRGSSNASVLMPGIAEIFWYCPSGKEDDRFHQCIAFINLHGDAQAHAEQTAFLQQISSVNVILLSTSDKTAMNSKTLQDLVKSPKPLICLCTDLENMPPVRVQNNVRIALRNRNESEIIGELKTMINSLLASCTPAYNLEECADVARQHGFLVDEDNEECTEGSNLAKTLMCLIGDTNITDVKEQFLPLQGNLWQTWCEKDKELSRLRDRGQRSIEQHRSEIESDKNAIRQSQVKRAYPLNELMRSLITILQSHSDKTKLYFLHWLKVYIDDWSSDQLLNFQQQYHTLWSSTSQEKQQNNDLNNAVQNSLEILSSKINASMFGLEHLLREVGQIYEALDALPGKNACLISLPQIAADMMVNGFPIELMDGDASCVPIKWIEAVFDELTKTLGDKRLFVLSVLGIQSTGKSTLLNTMFGLKFAVSAGRCTRGAFMQLVKVDENQSQDLGFDFILVVDTEGLRAIELANKSTLNHDNELATFVIGLGNMTLINIFGENPSEIQDILQIAVQAFLRMKQVKLSPRCLFVHQNVGDLAARDKNMEGRRRLQEKLDEMAQTAALHELCDVTCFSDVIGFDASNHIHYFSHLWEGNPPMAPLNPNYSQNVLELRNQILMIAKKEKQHAVLTMTQLKTRIKDLWRALLNENFVFSFKNTLEISAYSKLETKFSEWTWKLRSCMLNVQNKYNNRIKNGDMSQIDNANLEAQFQEPYGVIMKDLELYFTEDRDREILAQWKGNIEKRLQMLKIELLDEIKMKSKELIRYKKSQSALDQKKSEYEDNLFKKSKDLALQLKNEALDDTKLRENFNRLWIQWVTQVSNSAPKTEDPNILADVKSVILNTFQKESDILAKIENNSKSEQFILNGSKHIHMKRNWYGKQKGLIEHDVECINQVKYRLTKYICEYVATKRQQKMPYNVNYLHEIVNAIKKESESASSDSNFKLTATYEIDLSLYLCHIAGQEFIQMHKEFKQSNDPVTYLEGKREDFFNSFKISCQGATSITTFAEFLCNKLKDAVQSGVYDAAAIKVAHSMRCDFPAFNGNRANLEKYILISLAEKEDFEQYRQYVHFPRDYFDTFIKTCVEEYCHGSNNHRLINILNITLDFFHTIVLSAVGEATQLVKEIHGNNNDIASLWLDELCRKIGDDLNIKRSDLKVIEHQEIKDLAFLKEAMCSAWEIKVQSLKRSFASVTFEAFHVKPHEILAKQLCGCWEQCPFCKAICTNTISGHGGDHSVHFHRPQAVSGIQWYDSDHFVTDICSSLVASDCLLVLSESIQIPYRQYRKAGPAYANWSIMPDSSSQCYWKWYVCHFQSTLEKDYCGKFEGKGIIPHPWTDIKKEKVILELKEL